MKKLLVIMPCFLLLIGNVQAQKYYTKTGKITFRSNATLETIEAVNKVVTAIIDSKAGTVQVSVLMKGFEFEKALMQEHFNENYVESDKFSKAVFSGMIIDNDKVIYTKDGTYPVTVKGKLQLHGVEQPLETSGTVTIAKGIPQIGATFSVLLADYQIKVPSLVSDKISKQIKIIIQASLDNTLQ